MDAEAAHPTLAFAGAEGDENVLDSFSPSEKQQILQMKPHAIRHETQQLDFPGKLSADAQAFLRRALAPKREERSDVAELLADVYMQGRR